MGEKRKQSFGEGTRTKRVVRSRSPVKRSVSPVKKSRLGPVLLDYWSPDSTPPAPTGLTLANATTTMSGYVGSLRNNLTLHNAVYEVTTPPPPATGFSASVKLPFNSPVQIAHSTGSHPSKQAAKSSAAYNAICALYAAGEITSKLELTPKNPSKANRGGDGTGAKANKSAIAGSETYDYIATPKFWADSPPLSKRAFGSIVKLSLPQHPDEEGRCRQLLLVTSAPMPFTSPTRIDIGQTGVEAYMSFSPSHSLKLSGRREELAKGFAYTLGLLQATHSRSFSAKLEDTAYLILPLDRDYRGLQASAKDIDWAEVDAVAEPGPMISQDLPAKKLERQLFDRTACTWDQRKLLYYIHYTPSAEPSSSKNPQSDDIDHSAPGPLTVETERYVGPRTFGVVGSLALSQNQNRASEATSKGKTTIPLAGLKLHAISASSFRTASTLAEALTGLDIQLLAIELSDKLFKGKLEPSLARQAITTPSARPTATTDNYERIELLGDTLLKFIVGVSCYIQKNATQGEMSQRRHGIVNNATLQQAVIKSGIPPYIRVRYRAAKEFAPPRWNVEGVDLQPPRDQILGDKVLADVCEALIGAAYLSSERKMQAALDAMHTMHVPIQLRDWSSLRRTAVSPGAFNGTDRAGMTDTRREQEASRPLTLLGYKFKDPRKGRIALCMDRNHIRTFEFERYEYLGDALLDYLALESLWDEYPTFGPAPLTHMKHSRVSNAALSAYLVVSGLVDQLTDMEESMRHKLKKFRHDILVAQKGADELIAAGESAYEFWSSVPEYKGFGDILEAVFGAMYDDSDFDLATLQDVYARDLREFVRKYSVPPHGHSLHPKSALLELVAKRGCRKFQLVTNVKAVPPPQPRFTAKAVIHGKNAGEGRAVSQALASRNACAEALRYIQQKGGIEVLCDCKG